MTISDIVIFLTHKQFVMAHPKLFSLIDAIELKQINTLRKHIMSKVSEQSEAYQILESIIKTKDKREKYSDAESIQLAFYPTIKIKTFINYLSLLYGYAEEWIALTQMEIDEYAKDLLVQKWLNNNGLYSLSDQLVKKVLKKIESSEGLDTNDAKVKAEMLYENFFSNNPAKYDFNEGSFLEMIYSFDEYASSFYLILITELNNLGNHLQKNFNSQLEYILPKLNHIPPLPLTNILKMNFSLQTESNYEHFIKLKDILLQNKIKSGTTFHLILTNYIMKGASSFRKKGEIDTSEVIYNLTKYGLDTGIFSNNGKLSITTFHNLIVRLSILSSFEEIEQFIINNIEKVNTINKETTFSIAMAQNCFYHKRFSEIFKYAWIGDIEDFNQKLISQDLLLIYAFMKRKEDINYYKSSFKSTFNFLDRNKNKMTLDQKKRYDNLLLFMKRLEQNNIESIDLSDFKPIHYIAWCEYILKK